MLAEHPKRIAAAVEGISPARLRGAAVAGEWTAVEVLAHLRACSDTWLDVVPRILAAEHPRLEVTGPRVRPEEASYRRMPFATSFRAFARQRERLIAVMRELSPSDLSRGARIVERGRSRERMVQDYVDWLVSHELRHVDELERFGRRLARE